MLCNNGDDVFWCEIISTPLKNIGKALGNRDHTTVMHGIEKIENELQNDDNLKNTIDILKRCGYDLTAEIHGNLAGHDDLGVSFVSA